MINRIEYADFRGQTRDVEIPGGSIVIRGPSGSGKTTLIRAVSACLAGKLSPADRSSPGAWVRVCTVSKGTPGERRVGKGATSPTWPDALTQDPELAAVILQPGMWRDLGNRRFADLIARAGKAPPLREVVARLAIEAGHELAESDTIDERAVAAARTEAGRAEAAARAVVELQRERAARVVPPAPCAEGEYEVAHAVVALADRWARRPVDAAPVDPMVRRVAVEEARRLAAEAAESEAAGRDLASQEQAARSLLADADRAYRAAVDRDAATARASARIASVPCRGSMIGDVDCSTCGLISDARADAARPPAAPAGLEALETARARAGDASARLGAARRAHAALVERHRAAAASIPLEPPPRPDWTAPADPCPPVDVEAAARARVDAYARWERQAADARAVIADAERDLPAREAALAAAVAGLARADALLRAVRRAPTVRAEAARAAVAAHLEGSGVAIVDVGGERSADPGLTLTLHGRPWSDASTGEQIAGDAWIREALRRARGWRAWPLAIDEAQSTTCPLPAFVGPVWWIYTDGDPGHPFTVERAP